MGGKHLREALRKRESLREGDPRGQRHLRGKTHGKISKHLERGT